MNDFRLIPHHNIDEANQLYKEESKWLYDKIVEYTNKGKDLVIMTHHCPFSECIHGNYLTNSLSLLNAAYAIIDERSPFYDFVDNTNIKFWLFGHTHERYEKQVGNIKCVCNAVGYVGSPKFDYKIIEI
jgi:predicted phosphohydrolase